MPYIDKMLRDVYEGNLDEVCYDAKEADVGDLNYLVTRLVLAFLGRAPRYERYNAAIGALECAKLELYRRMVAPYEDGKRAANGDVYPRSEREIRDAASRREHA